MLTAVTLLVLGLDYDLASPFGRRDLQAEDAATVGEDFATQRAYGRAGLSAPANDVDAAADIFDDDIGERKTLARPLRDHSEFLRIAPIADLP